MSAPPGLCVLSHAAVWLLPSIPPAIMCMQQLESCCPPDKQSSHMCFSSCLIHRFADLLPLHTHWQQYITGLTGSARLGDGTHDATTLSKLVLAADLHGCCLEVVQSRDGRVVGAAGIVAKNTTSTLHIVDRSDKTHGGCYYQLERPGLALMEVMHIVCSPCSSLPFLHTLPQNMGSGCCA